METQRQRRARAELDRAPIQHRQRARQAETHGTRVRVGRVAKMRGAAAKYFRRSVQLRVDLKADDGFPITHSLEFQVAGSGFRFIRSRDRNRESDLDRHPELET